MHRVDTSLAPITGEWPRIPRGPYVSLHKPEWRTLADADYLVVHLDIAREVKDYWRFVYEDTVPRLAWPRNWAPPLGSRRSKRTVPPFAI